MNQLHHKYYILSLTSQFHSYRENNRISNNKQTVCGGWTNASNHRTNELANQKCIGHLIFVQLHLSNNKPSRVLINIKNFKNYSQIGNFHGNCQFTFNSMKTYLQLNTFWPVHNLHIKYSSKINSKILSNRPKRNKSTSDILARLISLKTARGILNRIGVLFRGYHTAVFISTRISRSSVDYQPEATAEGWWRPRPWYSVNVKTSCDDLFIIRSILSI